MDECEELVQQAIAYAREHDEVTLVRKQVIESTVRGF